MALNVTTAAIASGANTAIAQPSLAQWDQGQILKIEGVELPESYQVEFSGGGTVRTVPMIGTAEGVQIPNKLLQSSHPITAHIVLHESTTDRETEYWITIYVKPRQAPETVEIDPADISIIDQTIAAAQQAVATSTAQAEAAAGSAENAAASAEAAAGSETAAAGSASSAASSERSAGASAVEADQAKTAAETAQAAAEAAQAAAEQAVTDAQAAGSQAVEAIDEAKAAGIQAIDAEAATQINQVGRAGATQIRQINELASNQMRSIETKTTQSIGAIEDARDAAIDDVQTEGQAQTAAAQAQAQAAASSASAAANSASAAAGSASAAATARTGAETAAASVSASAAQIAQNASDITDLNRQISDVEENQIPELKSALNDVVMNGLEQFPFAISSSNNKWIEGNTLGCVVVPTCGGKKLIAKPKTYVANCAFLKSFSPEAGETPDYCSGETGRFILNNQETEYTIPSDCNYIYIMTYNNGNDYTPVKFEIDGYDFSKGIILNGIKTAIIADASAKEISENTDNIEKINGILNKQISEVDVSYAVENGYYYSNIGEKAALDGFCNITIDATNLVAVKVYGYQANVMAGLFFVDSNGNPIPDKDGDTYHVPSGSGYNTIEVEKPDGAVSAIASFSISSGRIYTASGFAYVFSDSQKMPAFDDVIMIPIFGQSLSVGAAATPVISSTPKYADGIMFNGGVVAAQKAVSFFTSFQPLHETTVETPASGCADKIAEQIQREQGVSVLSAYWDKHKILFVSCGAGSKTISDLTTNYYTGLQHAIQGAKNICDAEGLTLNIPCWIWIQGETDQKEDPSTSKSATSLSDYKNALTTLQSDLNTYAKGVTGQSNNLLCVCYQTASQNIVASTRTPNYSNTAVMGVPTAQMQLVRDNASFVASSPVYVMDHSTAEPIHLSNVGSKMLGLYCGIATKAVIFGETPPTGLVPLSYTIDGTTLTIKYKVPVPPIRIDTEWVKEVSHYGFALFDSSNNDLITGVSVFDDTITITCSASPLNAMLFYGFNGTEWKDGRLEGSRGNICDSAKFVFDGEIAGKRYALGNYAYGFVKLLSSSSGTI